MDRDSTIVASAGGVHGAISLIRISGPEAINICDEIFRPASGRPLSGQKGYTLHYGTINAPDGEALDEALVSLFRAPRSYTGEDMVEISCHGSPYIRKELINLIIRHGARSARAGEFTVRAFLNGKMDLSQAEAVADMTASRDRASHSLARAQLKGGYSELFSALRNRLVELTSLLELELDFGEEDVTFADRSQLLRTMEETEQRVDSLRKSFSLGNAIKEGVPVAIIGSPNAGKSTLLNRLAGEERAMVSDIEGTTRDTIEESVVIDGITFRFIDTAGVRETSDALEKMGIERTHTSIGKARVVLLLADGTKDVEREAGELLSRINLGEDQSVRVVTTKADKVSDKVFPGKVCGYDNIVISAKEPYGIGELTDSLSREVTDDPSYGHDAIVSNSRHYEALECTAEALRRARKGIGNGISAELLSQDIREAVHHIGSITGEITTDEILGTIFSKFCIGK